MRNFRSLLSCLTLLLLLLVLVVPSKCARSSSGRYSSSRYSSRYSSSYSSSKRYGSSRGSGYPTMSLLVMSRFSFRTRYSAYRSGIFFASLSWRRSYPDYSNSMPLCFNVQDSLPSVYNSSVIEPWLYQNRTVYGLYICPIDGQADKVYCCGDEDKERCCTFWEDGGRVAGLVLGVLLTIGSFAFVVVRTRKLCERRYGGGGSQVQAAATAQAASTVMELQTDPACQQPQQQAAGAMPEEQTDLNKEHQPPGYYEPPLLHPPATENPPYPSFAPPSYWEANQQQPQPLPPVRY